MGCPAVIQTAGWGTLFELPRGLYDRGEEEPRSIRESSFEEEVWVRLHEVQEMVHTGRRFR